MAKSYQIHSIGPILSNQYQMRHLNMRNPGSGLIWLCAQLYLASSKYYDDQVTCLLNFSSLNSYRSRLGFVVRLAYPFYYVGLDKLSACVAVITLPYRRCRRVPSAAPVQSVEDQPDDKDTSQDSD